MRTHVGQAHKDYFVYQVLLIMGTMRGPPSPAHASGCAYVYCVLSHAQCHAIAQFRAYERRENDESEDEDGYEGDFEEGGSDPFLAPVSSQGTRMFMYIRSMNKDTSDRLATLEQQVGDLLQVSAGTPAGEVQLADTDT